MKPNQLLCSLTIAGMISSLALTACSPSQFNTSEIQKTDSAIINGVDMVDGEELQTSIVAVYDLNEGGICTGTLLPNNLVLTAAHCVGEKIEMMYIFFGTTLTETSERLTVDKIEVSPYWETNKNNRNDLGDIALIHFVGKTPAGYKPANILSNGNKNAIQDGALVTVAGYGVSNGLSGEGAGTLRRTQVKVQSARFGNSEVLVNQEDGTGVCHGDSGGPAFVEVKGKQFFWGITSRGISDTDNDCTGRSAFTSVSYYRTWINRMSIKMATSIVTTELSR